MRTLCKKLETALKSRLIALLLLSVAGISAQAQQTASITEHNRWKAKITEIKSVANAPSGIPQLKWTPEEIWVEAQGPVQYARIKWKLEEPYKTVSINGKQLTPKADGSFDVNFGFTNNEKAFKVLVLDQTGKTFQGSYKILATGENVGPRRIQSRYRFNAGLGLTSIKYTQTNVTDFSEFAVTIKGGVSYRLVPDKFDLSLSAFMNAFALSSTSVYTIRYLGVNARVGYHLVKAPSPLRVVLNAGLYYNTSFGSIGFSNMYGPQLYPELSYIFPNGNAMLLYAKYSPALFQQKIDFSHNKEVATGLYYLFPLNTKYRMAVGFDISKLELSTDTDSAATTTYSLSAGLSF
jgi:hypothetical protein